MSKPLPNRNREKGANPVERLAPRISPQLVKRGCAQKESNLQPASSGATPHGLMSDFPASIRPESAQNPRRNPRTSFSNRHQSATATDGFSGSAHKPYALQSRPELIAGLDRWALPFVLYPTAKVEP